MKTIMLVTAFVLVGGWAFAQTEPETPVEGEPPVVLSHGQTISELAKTTSGGPEKGKLISSAARQRGLQQAEMRNNHSSTGEQASATAKSLRPTQAGKPSETGKPSALPRVSTPVRGKPAGLPGRIQ